MASARGRSTRDLIAEIKADAPHFGFFQAIRVLAMSQKGDGHPAAIPRALRFGTPLSLTFPASEIADVADRTGGPVDRAGDQREEIEALAWLMKIGFMGMTGPSGVLPTAYTELFIERRNFHRDTAGHAFLEMFSHRAVSLFYRAWRKHHFYVEYEAGETDSFSRNLLDFVGIGLKYLQQRLKKGEVGIPDVFLIHYSGLLSQKPLSAANIAALVRGYFGVPVALEQFVGQWIYVAPDEQSKLGVGSCVLGESAFSGERLWDRQTKMRLEIGPLSNQQFADFMPGSPANTALKELLQFCVGHSLACEVNLVLRKEDIPVPVLAASGSNLGYNTWLNTHPVERNAKDARFALLA